MAAMTMEYDASRVDHAVASLATRRTAPSIGYRCMRQNGLGASAACAMCTSIAWSLSDFTKSPFQYHCRPFGKNGSNKLLIAGIGIMPVQSKSDAGSCSSRGAMALRPAASEPLKHEMTAHARLFQCSFGKGSVGG